MGISTTAELIRSMARERGTRSAITYMGATLTYAELDERSSRIGQGLVQEGVAPQDRVALLDKNAPEHFEVLFGCAKANGVFVPVNWRLAPAEITYIINDSGAKVLFLGEEFFDHLEEIEGQLTTVKKIIAFGKHPRHESYANWASGQGPADPNVAIASDDVTLQMYTSGTTGLPKGVMITHDNLWSMVPYSKEWGVTSDAVSLVCMPTFHLSGTGWALTGMYHGCHAVLLREPDPARILEAIEKYGVNTGVLVPALLQFLLQRPEIEQTNFSSLGTILYGGAPIPTDVLTKAMKTFGCEFVQLYGLTESSGFATCLPATDHDPNGAKAARLRSVGKAPAGIEVRIVDPDTQTDVEVGRVGEIWVRSTGVMKGYWNQPYETAQAITKDGWLRTGDAAYQDEDGYLFLFDRVKDMIISGGENVYPAEVENVLHSHPGIADVGVIGVPDPKWGETVKAVVVRVPGAEVTEAEIIAFARDRLAHYKCPTSVDFSELLPRNAAGKILKRELREPYWKNHDRRIH